MPTQSQPTALPKHTPDKLYIKQTGPAPRFRIMRDGWDIAITFGQPGQEEDANQIIERYNSHPALVAENKRLREALELITKSNTFAGGPYKGELERIARAALAKEDV